MRNKLFVGVALVAALSLAACKHDLSTEEHNTANYGALKFAKDFDLIAGECSGLDSDGDGYVTCPMTPRSKDHPRVQAHQGVDALCSYGQAGCKYKN